MTRRKEVNAVLGMVKELALTMDENQLTIFKSKLNQILMRAGVELEMRCGKPREYRPPYTEEEDVEFANVILATARADMECARFAESKEAKDAIIKRTRAMARIAKQMNLGEYYTTEIIKCAKLALLETGRII